MIGVFRAVGKDGVDNADGTGYATLWKGRLCVLLVVFVEEIADEG